jgi:hypothetical protein
VLPPSRRREAPPEPLDASVQKDLGQITTNGHAFLVAEQQKIAQAPAFGGRMLPPQRHEARRNLADGGVRRRARQDAAFALARQKQQQEHADGLGLARAWRAPDEAELARVVSPGRRDAARNGVRLRVVELERGQRGRHVGVRAAAGVYASRGAQQWRALPINRVVSVLVGRKHERAERICRVLTTASPATTLTRAGFFLTAAS